MDDIKAVLLVLLNSWGCWSDLESSGSQWAFMSREYVNDIGNKANQKLTFWYGEIYFGFFLILFQNGTYLFADLTSFTEHEKQLQFTKVTKGNL